jgi:hypothetical protein
MHYLPGGYDFGCGRHCVHALRRGFKLVFCCNFLHDLHRRFELGCGCRVHPLLCRYDLGRG